MSYCRSRIAPCYSTIGNAAQSSLGIHLRLTGVVPRSRRGLFSVICRNFDGPSRLVALCIVRILVHVTCNKSRGCSWYPHLPASSSDVCTSCDVRLMVHLRKYGVPYWQGKASALQSQQTEDVVFQPRPTAIAQQCANPSHCFLPILFYSLRSMPVAATPQARLPLLIHMVGKDMSCAQCIKFSKVARGTRSLSVCL